MCICFVYLAVQEILSGTEGVKPTMPFFTGFNSREEGPPSSYLLTEGKATVAVVLCLHS